MLKRNIAGCADVSAERAGVWDQLKPRIDMLQELTLAGWPKLADGQAGAVLAPLFVKGLAYKLL